jgi:ligand-binding sensor domain-containing protein
MKTLLFTLFAGLAFALELPAQNPEWIVYNTTNSGLTDNDIRSLDIDNNGQVWIGSINKAIFTFDGTTWNHYNSANSYVYDNYILSISTDTANNRWIGSRSGGLCMYDGTNWHLYDTDHSGIPSDKVSDIQFEGSIVWVATQKGLAKFDRTNWTVYNTSNSGMPGDEVRGVAIDKQGNKWVATWSGGLGKFDGTNWTTYNPSNSLMPTKMCISIYFDGTFIWVGTSLGGHVKFDGSSMEVLTPENSGILNKSVFDTKKEGQKLWFATAGGLASLEGASWTAFTPENSGLPSVYTRDIEIDKFGNKWIATDKGVAVYREGGVVGKVESAPGYKGLYLYPAYPNPAREFAVLNWHMDVPGKVTLTLFDHIGKAVTRFKDISY